MNNKLKGLEEHRKEKSKEKRERAQRAIKDLYDLNEIINVNTVAKKANVSRQYIYNHIDILSLIKESKEPSIARNQRKVASLKASSKSNESQLRLIKERYQKLLRENKALKEEIKILQAYIDDLET